MSFLSNWHSMVFNKQHDTIIAQGSRDFTSFPKKAQPVLRVYLMQDVLPFRNTDRPKDALLFSPSAG